MISLETLGLLDDFVSNIMGEMEKILELVFTQSTLLTTKKTPCGFLLQAKVEIESIVSLILEASDFSNEISQLEHLTEFISKSMFSSNFRPPASLVDLWAECLQKHIRNRVVESDSDPSVLLKIKQFTENLLNMGI